MAYVVKKPSGSGRATVTRPKASTSYSGALAGFSTDLSSIRKSLLAEQSAAIDYQIEVGSKDINEKIELYSVYLDGLEPNTKEWYRVATKVENLQDSRTSQDFSLLKNLYTNDQITTSEYYEALKERVNEGGISQNEQLSRSMELSSFQNKMEQKNTDAALKEAILLEESGIINASQRLELMTQALELEDDPARRQTLQKQVFNQQKKVRTDDLTRQELMIELAIDQGLATEEDLLPVYVKKMETSLTENEQLRNQKRINDLVGRINTTREAQFSKSSKNLKKEATKEVRFLDREIEKAKIKGDLVKLNMLYNKKTNVIATYWDNPNVTEGDKDVTTFQTFSREVLGKDVDIETGDFFDVAPIDQWSQVNVQSGLLDPRSSLVVSEVVDGVVQSELVRGVPQLIPQPDGTMKTVFDYGGREFIQTGERAEGPGVPVTVSEIVRDPGYQLTKARFEEAGVPLAREYTGEQVTFRDPQTGEIKTSFVLEGQDLDKRLKGVQPIPGSPGKFVLDTEGQVPTKEVLKQFKAPFLSRALGVSQAEETAAEQAKVFETGQFFPKLPGFLGEATKVAQATSLSLATGREVKPAFDTQKFQDILSRIREGLQFGDTPSSDLTKQLTTGLFKDGFSDIAKTTLAVQRKDYTSAIQGAASSVFKTIAKPFFETTALGKTQQFFTTAASKFRSFLGGS